MTTMATGDGEDDGDGATGDGATGYDDDDDDGDDKEVDTRCDGEEVIYR